MFTSRTISIISILQRQPIVLGTTIYLYCKEI